MIIKIKFVQSQINDIEFNGENTLTLQQIEERIKTRECQSYFENHPNQSLHFIFRSRVWNDKTVNLEEMGFQDGMSIIVYALRQVAQPPQNNNPQPTVGSSLRSSNLVFNNQAQEENQGNQNNNSFTDILNSFLGPNNNLNPPQNNSNQFQTFNIPLMDIYLNESVEENLARNNLEDTNYNRTLVERTMNHLNANRNQNNPPPNNENEFPPLPNNNIFSSLFNSTLRNNPPPNNDNLYQSRLEEIQNMGFTQPRAEILDALRQANGSLDGAIDILLQQSH